MENANSRNNEQTNIVDTLTTISNENRKVLEMVAGLAGIALPEKVTKKPKASSPYLYTDKDLIDMGKVVSENVEAIKKYGVKIVKLDDLALEDDLYNETMTQLINKRTSKTIRMVVNPETGKMELVQITRPSMAVEKSDSCDNNALSIRSILAAWARAIFPNGILGAKDSENKTYLVGVGNKKALFIKTQEYK